MRYGGFKNVLYWICIVESTEAQERYHCEAPVGVGVPGPGSAIEELPQRTVECDVSIAVWSTQSVVRGQRGRSDSCVVSG
jgi:hypothetical protein